MKKIIAIGIIAMLSCMTLIPIGTSTEANVPKNENPDIHKLSVRVIGRIKVTEEVFKNFDSTGFFHTNIDIDGSVNENGISFTRLIYPDIQRTSYVNPDDGDNHEEPLDIILKIGFFFGKINKVKEDGICYIILNPVFETNYGIGRAIDFKVWYEE